MSNYLPVTKNVQWSRRGAILPLFALTFAGLLLFLGLVVDDAVDHAEAPTVLEDLVQAVVTDEDLVRVDL